MMNIGEKILNFLEKHSPERFDRKVMNTMEKISEEAAKAPPMTKEEEDRAENNLMFFFAITFFAFIYVMYLLLF